MNDPFALVVILDAGGLKLCDESVSGGVKGEMGQLGKFQRVKLGLLLQVVHFDLTDI